MGGQRVWATSGMLIALWLQQYFSFQKAVIQYIQLIDHAASGNTAKAKDGEYEKR